MPARRDDRSDCQLGQTGSKGPGCGINRAWLDSGAFPYTLNPPRRSLTRATGTACNPSHVFPLARFEIFDYAETEVPQEELA
jgi:hypothetical protein